MTRVPSWRSKVPEVKDACPKCGYEGDDTLSKSYADLGYRGEVGTTVDGLTHVIRECLVLTCPCCGHEREIPTLDSERAGPRVVSE